MFFSLYLYINRLAFNYFFFKDNFIDKTIKRFNLKQETRTRTSNK